MGSAPFRMIAIDLDGTLLSPQGKVTQRVKQAVHRALDAGLLVCFATGRNFTESRSVLEDVAHYDTAVFVGGAMVIDTAQRVTLHRMLMEPALAAAICAEFEAAGHAALALQDTATAGLDYFVSATIPLNESTVLWWKVTDASFKAVADLGNAARHQHTVRVSIVAGPDEIATMTPRLDEKFAGRIYYGSVRVPSQGVEVLEV